jgi:hypothetical protein
MNVKRTRFPWLLTSLLLACGQAPFKEQESEELGVTRQELGGCFILGHDPIPDDPTADGALVREASRPEIYLVYGRRKWWIPSESTLFGMNYTWADVRIVPDGTLASLPTEYVISDRDEPGIASTPGSLIWPPGAVNKVATAAPGTRFLRSRCRDVRLATLRGWIRVVETAACHTEPNWGADWHFRFEVDPASVDEIGGDLNRIVRAANVVWYDLRGFGQNPFAAVALPTVDIEINGLNDRWFVPGDWVRWDRFQPPLPEDVAGDCNGSTWPYDPRIIPNNPMQLLNKYVEIKGSLLSDDPHYGQASPQMRDALYAWEAGMSRGDGRNEARTAEIHPPDRIRVLDDRAQTESVYAVAVSSQNCGISGCQERVLDYTMSPPSPRPPWPAQIAITESVDETTTTFSQLTIASVNQRGAQITPNPISGDSARIRVGTRGQNWWGHEGHFKAMYRATWRPCVSAPGGGCRDWPMVFSYDNALRAYIGDWAPYNYKAECGVAEPMVGLSKSTDTRWAHASLCRVEDSARYPHDPNACWPLDFSRDTVRYTFFTGDWDIFYYKGECAPDEYSAGVSQSTDGRTQAMLCCRGAVGHNNCAARVIEGGSRETESSGDWDPNYWKAECGEGRYVGGISRHPDTGAPHAILCCSP